MLEKERRKGIAGITLISLVITIIVLLILSTATIMLAVDSNGLFSRAGTAANKWNTSVATYSYDLIHTVEHIKNYNRR